jgi:hypothetical protein
MLILALVFCLLGNPLLAALFIVIHLVDDDA